MKTVRNWLLAVGLLGGLLANMSAAHAIIIEYTLVSLGGTTYRYDYTLTNDGSLGTGVALELFDIEFDPALYEKSTLTIVTSDPPASDWDEYIFLSIPDIIPIVPATYSVLALGDGIADGNSVTGFAVRFNWLGGPAGPGPQPFLVYDPDNFDLLLTGITRNQQPGPGPGPIPEPGSLFLLGLGLLPLAWAARSRNPRRSSS